VTHCGAATRGTPTMTHCGRTLLVVTRGGTRQTSSDATRRGGGDDAELFMEEYIANDMMSINLFMS
jgi:hypothetical protein